MAAAAPFIIMAMSVASTAIAYSSAKSAGKDRQAEMTRRAAAEKLAAEREASDTKKKHQRIIASQEALYGKAGLTMEGSPLLVQQESLIESKEQLRRIRESGGLQAEAYQASGAEALRAGEAESMQSLLAGAESAYSTGSSYDWW